MHLTEQQFLEIWNRLHLVMGLTPPSDERRVLCEQVCRKRIDQRAMGHIKRRIDALEAKPRNVAAFFLAVAAEWKGKNPEMQARPGNTCAACEDGVIYMLKRHPLHDHPIRTCGTCGHCQPGGMWTKQSIEACGMEWLAPGWQDTGRGGERGQGYIWPRAAVSRPGPRVVPTTPPPLPYNPDEEMTA